jgi:two-component system, chemotaxis family, chemotaxis protein CheY
LNPDAITMDITMPEMDGLTALKEIISYDSNAKVIMCSAMGQQFIVVEAIKLGAVDFVEKPFQTEQVVKALSKALNL